MTTKKFLTDCQFCWVVSKAKGEDPIGTVNEKGNPDWAEVRVDFTSPDGR